MTTKTLATEKKAVKSAWAKKIERSERRTRFATGI